MRSTIEHTRLRGAGEPVVLVHGIGHRREAWGRVPELLAAKGYDVLVVDLPGFGTSPAPTRPDGWSMRSHAEQLERLVRDLGMAPAHVIGNSLGGRMALEMARRGSVRSALALSPAGFMPPHHLLFAGANLLFLKAGSYLPEGLHRRLNASATYRRLAYRSLYARPEQVDPAVALGDTLNLRRSPGFWPHLLRSTVPTFRGPVTSPTTIAWGDTDRLLLPSQAQVARTRLPEAEHVTLQRCGHCPQVDDPELIVEVAEATFARSRADQERLTA